MGFFLGIALKQLLKTLRPGSWHTKQFPFNYTQWRLLEAR